MYVSDYLAFFWTDFNAVFSIIFFSDLGEGFRDLIKKMEAKENWVGSFFLKGGTFCKALSVSTYMCYSFYAKENLLIINY